MARPRIHDADLRERLIDVAIEIVGSKGLGALSVRTAAQGASTSTTAVYSLFGSKDELTRAVLVRAFRRFSTAQRAALDARTGEPLMDLGVAYVGWALANPRLYELMFVLTAVGIEPSPETSAAGVEAFTPLHDAVCQAIESGTFRRADPMTVAASLWSQVHGAALLLLAGLFPESADPALAIGAIVDGWRAAPR
ncbi:TetR/AcrR family transcriptional regulator [Gordonia sp. DT219]|uniref:TetR/AcrR family transcriptional regulator n=1 Tax=Gordonia sp. DT219 TaxID=3416658 RepID=UPI003CF741C6